MPERAFLRSFLAAVAIVALCFGLVVSLAAGAPVFPRESPAPGEESVAAKVPVIATGSPEPAEKPVTARSADLATTPNATASPEITTTPSPGRAVTDLATIDEEEEPVPTLETPNATITPEPIVSALEATDDEEEDEGEPVPVPTLEREAPPRPNATMARSHQFIDRPLPQGDHQLIRPASPLAPEKNETEAPPPDITEPPRGLFVRGVGVLLARTPEDVALTRNGMEVASFDWLLDVAMLLGGRHPRVAMEGERFTVTVTVEALNMTLPGDESAYVVLVPPPGEIAVYDITRTREPQSLRAGERGVWEFSVVTRIGRLMLENLTLPEERLITDMTSYPDTFAFRAYALAGDQETPSTGLSDPVIAIRPDGSTTERSTLPALYTLLGVGDSILQPSETMIDAWRRGVDYGEVTAVTGEHLGALGSLGKEEVAAVHAGQGRAGAEAAGASPSPLDLIAGFFRGIFERLFGPAGQAAEG